MIRNIIIVAVYLLNYGYDESGAIPLTMNGGNPSPIIQNNFLVSVHIELPGGLTFFCGGCIISRTFVITAAHCVDGLEPEYVRVRIGSQNLFRGGQYKNITSINVEEYIPETRKHDVGLLHLKNVLTFNDNVGKIYYPDQYLEFEYAVGTTVKVLGFGWTDDGSYVIQVAYMMIVDNTECERLTADFDHRFCIKNESIKISTYDDGCPIIYGNMIIGIVSLANDANETDRSVIQKVPAAR